MKFVLTGLITIAAFSLYTASAQTSFPNNNPSENYGRDRGDARNKMMEKLNLSDTQKNQINDINRDSRSKMESLKQNTNLSEAEMQAQRKSIEENKNSRITAILNADQKNQWEQMKKERSSEQQGSAQWNQNADRGQMGQGGRGQDRMEQMKQDLNLSDDQMARFKTTNDVFRERSRSIMDNQSITPQDKKAQFDKLRMERQESMKSILTPDQMIKMENMIKGRKEKFKEKKREREIKNKG